MDVYRHTSMLINDKKHCLKEEDRRGRGKNCWREKKTSKERKYFKKRKGEREIVKKFIVR
jgi:hypothetical protein